MFLKLAELSDNQYSQLTESNIITENVVFNDVEYGLSEDIYEIEGEYYVGLTEDVEVEEDNETVLTVEGRDYIVCESEEDADFVAFLSEDENGEFTVVDEDDEYEHALYVKEVN